MNTYTHEKWISKTGVEFGYLRYLPEDYEKGESFPLVVFLHGAGERGNDLEKVAVHGYLKHVREGMSYPFVCVAPQCPDEKYWGCFTESLIEFVDFAVENLKVDKARVYLTGLSMGGTGTWMLAMAAPEKFAAIAPVCGSGICWYGEALKNVPVFAYHGDCDEVVPAYESVNMVGRVNQRGGFAKVKIIPGRGHHVWKDAYSDDELLSWLLSQVKKSE